MNHIKHALIGDICVNLDRINYVRRFSDGTVIIYFAFDEALPFDGRDGAEFWKFYTSYLNQTKRIENPEDITHADGS